MSTATTGPGAEVLYPSATAHLTMCAEPSPGMWLNEATRALAEAGAQVAEVLSFRRAARAGDTATLLATICCWVRVD